jgi:selenocysteine-specific translation elongation factor
MQNYIIAVPLDKSIAEFIGKKGSENSITFYNRIYADSTIVALTLTSIEEKPYALAESLLLANQVVLSTSNIDKNFGEALVAAGLSGKKIILTDDNDVNAMLKGAGISNYIISTKEELLDRIIENKNDESLSNSSLVRIDIDKSFNVKGIGTVVLGIVTSGTVNVHDTLFSPDGKSVSVRSIQSQDRDIESALLYTRVGLALKGVESESISKGDVLSNEQILKVSSAKASIKISDFGKEEILIGNNYGFASNFSFVNATVVNVSDIEIELKFEKSLQLTRGDKFMLLRQKRPRIFASGTIL